MKMNNLELELEQENQDTEKDILNDPKYVCLSSSLITESLKKGCDVMQMPNGDIIITEVKTVTTKHSWNSHVEVFVKSTTTE